MLITDDGESHDVTEAVKVLYDLAVNSMDFGSGFWSAEDAAPVAKLGQLCGFDGADAVRKYVSKTLASQEAQEFIRQHADAIYPGENQYVTPYGRYAEAQDEALRAHECVFSSQGNCMWPLCDKEGFPG